MYLRRRVSANTEIWPIKCVCALWPGDIPRLLTVWEIKLSSTVMVLSPPLRSFILPFQELSPRLLKSKWCTSMRFYLYFIVNKVILGICRAGAIFFDFCLHRRSCILTLPPVFWHRLPSTISSHYFWASFDGWQRSSFCGQTTCGNQQNLQKWVRLERYRKEKNGISFEKMKQSC